MDRRREQKLLAGESFNRLAGQRRLMVDAADKAQKTISQAADLAVAEIRQRADQREASATGYCLNCGRELDSDQRWCDALCRDEWAETRERDDFDRDNQGRL